MDVGIDVGIESIHVDYERSIHVDRDVGIDKITSDQFMLTGM